MQFWREMPPRMYLKSPASASSIHAPQFQEGFPGYLAGRGIEPGQPCPIVEFSSYGASLQRQVLPELENVLVTSVRAEGDKFLLQTEAGDHVLANHVVVAAGLKAFARLPRPLQHIDPQFVSHSSAHSSFMQFTGKKVFVIGAGQSALQAAVLLHEAGARVEVFVRGGKINFSEHTPQKRSLLARLRRPQTGLGAGIKNWLIETFPGAISHLPEAWRMHIVKTHLGPSVAWWLAGWVKGFFPIHYNMSLEGANVGANVNDGTLFLSFRNLKTGTETIEHCDHLIAGTGFEVNIDRLKFLCPALRRRIVRTEGSPRLDQYFQSSVPALHFVGTASAMSFGPLFRFILGTGYTAKTLAAHLARPRAAGRVSLAMAPTSAPAHVYDAV